MLFHSYTKDGFTLVELIVVVGIISIISAIVFQSGNKFNDTVAIQSVAEDVALAAREAQAYGVSVKDSTGTGSFTLAYGIDFDLSHTNYVTVFVDSNSDGIYEDGSVTNCNDGTNECIEKVVLRDGVTISSICGINTAGATICSRSYQAVQTTFLRPSLNASIVFTNINGIVQPGSWQAARIILKSVGGVNKTILIGSTGLISIQ